MLCSSRLCNFGFALLALAFWLSFDEDIYPRVARYSILFFFPPRISDPLLDLLTCWGLVTAPRARMERT